MLTARRALANGDEGTLDTLATMNRLRDLYGTFPAIRRAALVIGGSEGDDDQLAQVKKFAAFVRRAVVYRQDPLNSELMQTPDVMLLEINATGQAFGDCDDHVLLFSVLCEAVGVACDIAGVKAPGSDTVNHVIAIAHPNGDTIEIDLCAKRGCQPEYPEKMIAP